MFKNFSFGCKNLLDYTELYVRSDRLILSDTFENFRKICKTIYGLDLCHYYTAPGLSFDVMLKTTKTWLELIPDVDMYNMIKNGIRRSLV